MMGTDAGLWMLSREVREGVCAVVEVQVGDRQLAGLLGQAKVGQQVLR